MPDTCKALIMGDAIYPYLPPLLINRPCAQNPSMSAIAWSRQLTEQFRQLTEQLAMLWRHGLRFSA
jgi:hypothetical protein